MAKTIQIDIDPAYFFINDHIDEHFGFAKWICRVPLGGRCPNTFQYIGKIQATNEVCPDRVKTEPALWAGGMDIDHLRAYRSCIFESIERYASALVDLEGLVTGSEIEMIQAGFNMWRSEEFDLFSPEQYEAGISYDRWKPESVLRWKSCLSLCDDITIYVPAQFIYAPYSFDRNEPRLFDQLSTGIACHRTYESAMIRGLCEAVERDAFMIYWLNMLPSPAIDPRSLLGLDPSLDMVLNRVAEVPGLEITFKDITTDLSIPTVLCILRNRKDPEAVAAAFAAATDLDARSAIRRAANEVLGTYSLAHRLRFEAEQYANLRVHPGRWNLTRTLDDHTVNFAFPEIHRYIKWIDRGDTISADQFMDLRELAAPKDPKRALAFAADCLARIGLKPCGVDLTPIDIRDMGFYVVRAVIPGLVPLHGPHPDRPLGSSRLRTGPKAMGFDCPERLNAVPHPYP